MEISLLVYFSVTFAPLAAFVIFFAVYLIIDYITCGMFGDACKNLLQQQGNRPREEAPPPPPPLVFDKYRKRSKEEAGGGGCSVCLGEYEDGERRARIAACNHRYHAVCIEAWLRENRSCPLCRHDIA